MNARVENKPRLKYVSSYDTCFNRKKITIFAVAFLAMFVEYIDFITIIVLYRTYLMTFYFSVLDTNMLSNPYFYQSQKQQSLQSILPNWDQFIVRFPCYSFVGHFCRSEPQRSQCSEPQPATNYSPVLRAEDERWICHRARPFWNH